MPIDTNVLLNIAMYFTFIMGILHVLFPRAMIKFRYMYIYHKGAEPLGIAVFFTMIGGFIYIIIGLLIYLYLHDQRLFFGILNMIF